MQEESGGDGAEGAVADADAGAAAEAVWRSVDVVALSPAIRLALFGAPAGSAAAAAAAVAAAATGSDVGAAAAARLRRLTRAAALHASVLLAEGPGKAAASASAAAAAAAADADAAPALGPSAAAAPSPSSFSSVAAPASLIELPHAFDRLYASVAARSCFECGRRPANAILCLVCGALLCAMDECCRGSGSAGGGGGGGASVFARPRGEARAAGAGAGAGEATRHAVRCGGGTGVMVLVASAQRAGATFLLRGEFAAQAASLYVDEDGEDDVGLKRGRPLFLSRERLAALRALWAAGEVGREVTRLRAGARELYRESVL